MTTKIKNIKLVILLIALILFLNACATNNTTETGSIHPEATSLDAAPPAVSAPAAAEKKRKQINDEKKKQIKRHESDNDDMERTD